MQKHPVKLMERSIWSAKYCFVENLYRRSELRNMSDNNNNALAKTYMRTHHTVKNLGFPRIT